MFGDYRFFKYFFVFFELFLQWTCINFTLKSSVLLINVMDYIWNLGNGCLSSSIQVMDTTEFKLEKTLVDIYFSLSI